MLRREAPGPGHGTDGSLNRGLRQISMMQNRRSFKFKAVPNRQNMVPRERNTRLQQSWPVPEVRFKRIADIYSGSNQNKKNNLCRDPQFSNFSERRDDTSGMLLIFSTQAVLTTARRPDMDTISFSHVSTAISRKDTPRRIITFVLFLT